MKPLFRVSTVLMLLVPIAVIADSLVPCGLTTGPLPNAALNATNCGLCDLGQLIQNVINFLIGISIPIAVALFAWAGILYFTAATEMSKIERAKSIFKSVLIGFIIILSSWLIVQTFLNALVGKDFFTSGSWNTLQCVDQQHYQANQRPRNANIGDIFNGIPTGPSTVVPGTSSTVSSSGSGVPVQLTTIGPDGTTQTITLNTTNQNLTALQQQYLNVRSQYGNQIDAACAGSSMPNCGEVTAALIVKESSGNPATGCNGSHSCGLMQLSTANGGASCSSSDSTCIGSQITKGVQFLNQQYTNSTFGGNVPNALAAYNGGNSTTPGSSPSGKNPPMATSNTNPSLGCGSSYYAWQCTTQPGDLAETQQYVATICAITGLNGASCQ